MLVINDYTDILPGHACYQGLITHITRIQAITLYIFSDGQ